MHISVSSGTNMLKNDAEIVMYYTSAARSLVSVCYDDESGGKYDALMPLKKP